MYMNFPRARVEDLPRALEEILRTLRPQHLVIVGLPFKLPFEISLMKAWKKAGEKEETVQENTHIHAA